MANKKSEPEKPKKRYVLQFSSMSLVFSGIGFIFILIWVFALGIMVGRGLLPDRMERILAFKGKAVNDDQSNKADQVQLIKEEDLTFYDQLIDNTTKDRTEAPPQAPPKEQAKPAKRIKMTHEEASKTGSYRVQVAALNDREKTEETVARLVKAGYPAYYIKALINGKVYYRIRCGRFSSADQAKRIAARLSEQEGFKPFIVYPNSE
jgi:cell division septation protein DedD